MTDTVKTPVNTTRSEEIEGEAGHSEGAQKPRVSLAHPAEPLQGAFSSPAQGHTPRGRRGSRPGWLLGHPEHSSLQPMLSATLCQGHLQARPLGRAPWDQALPPGGGEASLRPGHPVSGCPVSCTGLPRLPQGVHTRARAVTRKRTLPPSGHPQAASEHRGPAAQPTGQAGLICSLQGWTHRPSPVPTALALPGSPHMHCTTETPFRERITEAYITWSRSYSH